MVSSNNFPKVFPKECEALLRHLEKVSGMDYNTTATAYLTAYATAIGNNVKLDNGKWISKPNLFSVLIGRSGSKKSPAMKDALSFFIRQDSETFKRWEEECEQAEDITKVKRPANQILRNFTIESVSHRMKASPKGIIIFADEMWGTIKNLSKYSGGSSGDLEEIMKLWDGNPYSVERVHQKPIFLDDPCLNLIGATQNDVVHFLCNENSLIQGFYFRFLLSRMTRNEPNLFNEEERNKDIFNNVEDIFKALTEYPETMLTLGTEAKKMFIAWQHKAEEENFDQDFHNELQQKLVTYVFRFCIIMDVLDQVTTGKTRAEVTGATMEKALLLAEYFRRESTEIYLSVYSKNTLSKENLEFRKKYNKLESGKEYSKAELVNHFDHIKEDMVNKKLKKSELFTRVKRGFYVKTIDNDFE